MTTLALRKRPEQRDGAELPPSIAVGALLDEKYRVESVLGRGGMADVFRARHEQLGHRVAVKVLRPELTCPSFAKRALREARAAAGLTSEHVTRVLDIGTLPTGEPFLVMELLEGIDFAELLRRRGPLTVSEAAGYLLQVCDALGEAHDGGIVHRDLKPSNLFLGSRRDGTPLVKLMDFGISKIEGETADDAPSDPLTVPREILGTPHYMSPEQLTNPRNVDCRTDIWALGVLLFRLLTAEFPFAGDTPGSVLSQIASRAPVPLRAKRPDLPTALEELVNKCLEKSPDHRLPSARAFARTLLDFCDEDDRRRYAHVADSEAPAPPPASSDTVRTSKTRPLSPLVEGRSLETNVEWPPGPAEGDAELTVAVDVAAEASDEPTIALPAEPAPAVRSAPIELAIDPFPALSAPELAAGHLAALSFATTTQEPIPMSAATAAQSSGASTNPARPSRPPPHAAAIAVSTDPAATIRATTPLMLTTTSTASTDPGATIRTTMPPMPSAVSTASLTRRTSRRRTAALWAGAVGVIVGATGVGALARILTSAPPPVVETVAAPAPSASAPAPPAAAFDHRPPPERSAAPASIPTSVTRPMSVVPFRTPEPIGPASSPAAQPQFTQQPVQPQATPQTTQPPVQPQTTQPPVQPQTTQPPVQPQTMQPPVQPQTTRPRASKMQPRHGEARSRDPYGDRL